MARLEPGSRVDRYEVVGLLGQGGQAVVWEVRHVQLGTRHALKVLAIDRPQLVARFQREGQVQAALKHPNLVAATDVLDVDGRPGLVLELVDGVSLDAWLAAHPNVDEAVRHRLARHICSAVAFAHAHDTIHRDLKPANVMVTGPDAEPWAKVTDFGLAKHLGVEEGATRTGVGMGTPRYMAPEQIRDAKTVDTRADVFALGCVLYEIWCGRHAFDQDAMLDIFEAIQAGDYEVPPGVPDDVARAIRGALQPDPDRRIRSADELLAILEGEGASTALAAPARVPVDPRAPRRGLAWLAFGSAAFFAATLLGVVVVLGLAWFGPGLVWPGVAPVTPPDPVTQPVPPSAPSPRPEPRPPSDARPAPEPRAEPRPGPAPSPSPKPGRGNDKDKPDKGNGRDR